MSDLIPALAQIDTRVLMVLVALVIVVGVVSVAKKAIKSSFLMLALAIVFCAGISLVNALKEDYAITFDKDANVLYFKVDGADIEFSFKELEAAIEYKIVLEQGGSKTKINLYYRRKDGSAVSETGSNALSMPNFMAKLLRQHFDSAGIDYTLQQTTGAFN